MGYSKKVKIQITDKPDKIVMAVDLEKYATKIATVAATIRRLSWITI